MSMEWDNDFQISPVTQEGIRGPVPHGLYDVRRGSGGEKLCGASDAEAVTGGAGVSKFGPNLVAPAEEGDLCERAWTRGCGESK